MLLSILIVLIFSNLIFEFRAQIQYTSILDSSTSYYGNQALTRDVYDFIVIGAGSGGSVVANRLSENGNWSVLLLEAGGDETFLSRIPLMAALQGGTNLNWDYVAEKSDKYCLSLENGRCRVTRGKVLGGTSSINFLLYTRGNKQDFDLWEQLGNKGWSYKDVLPYFVKNEDCSTCRHVERKYHGVEGPQFVENVRYNTTLQKKFLKAGTEFGYKIRDPSGEHNIGFFEVLGTSKNGRRYSANSAYLRPVWQRQNLQILIRSRVIKILIDKQSQRAYGVEFIKDRLKYRVGATKEVILSAGSINSPHILMHSGIGPRAVLEKAGVDVIADLPVGYNLQDHIAMPGLVFLVNESITISDVTVQNPQHFLEYILNGRGPYAIPGGALGTAFVKTKYSSHINDDYPDIELVLGAGGLNGDTFGSLRHLAGIPQSVYDELYKPWAQQPSFSIIPALMRPRSRGRVTIRDNNPLHWPRIDLNYYGDERDLDIMVEGVKMAIALATTTPSFQTLNTTYLHVPYSKCSSHTNTDPAASLTDSYIRCMLRHLSSTLGHHAGTCAMGSVVDERLRVIAGRGGGRVGEGAVRGLRVIDASVMPTLIAGHPNSVVMMIAEKASDIIKEDWGWGGGR